LDQSLNLSGTRTTVDWTHAGGKGYKQVYSHHSEFCAVGMVRRRMGSVGASGVDFEVPGLLSFDPEVKSRTLLLGPGNIGLSWFDPFGGS
jgi:hypothetical protein